nr:Retrovirus-related Pol polyprotein from transposon TNT 1-94 [Ipomoea batatas]
MAIVFLAVFLIPCPSLFGQRALLAIGSFSCRLLLVVLLSPEKLSIAELYKEGYKLLDVQTKEIFLSRDVSFYEDTFPYQHSQDKKPSNLVLPSKGMSCLTYDEDISLPTHEALPDSLEIPAVTPAQNNEPVDTEVSPSPEPRRSTRVRTKPAYLDDYTCQNTIKRRSPHDISKFMSYESLSQAYKEAGDNSSRNPIIGRNLGQNIRIFTLRGGSGGGRGSEPPGETLRFGGVIERSSRDNS